MEKEKNKGNPKRRKIVSTVLTVMLLLIVSLCGAFSYYIYPGHSLSDFSRFESEEEVVAFLHDNFDIGVTTYAEIQTFMSAYPLEYIGCETYTPTKDSFAGGIIIESVAKIMRCTVPYWEGFPGTRYVRLRFDIDTNDRLAYIEAYQYCICL